MIPKSGSWCGEGLHRKPAPTDRVDALFGPIPMALLFTRIMALAPALSRKNQRDAPPFVRLGIRPDRGGGMSVLCGAMCGHFGGVKIQPVDRLFA